MKHLGTSRIITFIHKYLQLWLTDIADTTRTTCKHHIIINFLIHISPHHNNLEMKLGEGYDNIIDTPATTHTDLHRPKYEFKNNLFVFLDHKVGNFEVNNITTCKHHIIIYNFSMSLSNAMTTAILSFVLCVTNYCY